MPSSSQQLVRLDVTRSFWDRFFMVAPLVVIGTSEDEGYNLAPKHMATPLGWGPYFGFVCTPRHRTYHNVKHTKRFTVTFVRPSQVVLASLAAAPRRDGPGHKPTLDDLPTFPAKVIDGIFLEDGYLFLECELKEVLDGYGENSMLIGEVVAAYVDDDAMRVSEQDDEKVIRASPLLAYLPPGRYAVIEESNTFPFPFGFKK
jgi:flavin reductase (DIM6/NTAB) family NADH-FMN oxidoreductase RutF